MRRSRGTFPIPGNHRLLAARQAPPRAAITKKNLARHTRRGGR